MLRTVSALCVLAIAAGSAAPTLACSKGVALPVRHLETGGTPCAGGDLVAGEKKAQDATDRATEELRQRLNRDLYAYEVRNFAITAGGDGAKLFKTSPWGKAITRLPVAGAVYDIATGHVKTYLEKRNASAFDSSVGTIYADYLAQYPTAYSTGGDDLTGFVTYLGGKLSWEQYGVVGKQIDAQLIDEVKALHTALARIRAERRGQPESRPQTSLSDAAKAEIARIRQDVDTALTSAAADTAHDIDILRTYVAQAATERQALAGQLGGIRQQVDAQAAQIAANTAQLQLNSGAIDAIQSDMVRFSLLQERTASLTADNAVRLDTVSAVLFDNADAKSQLRLLRSGAMGVTAEEQQRLEKVVEANIAQRETIEMLDDLSLGVEVAGKALELGVKAGLSPEDARRGSQLLSVVQIGIGIGRVYAGDMTGLVGVLGGASDLFGGGGPDPAQQAIMQQFAIVNAKLDHLSDQVEGVSQQVDALARWSVEAHHDVMQQLSVLEGLGRSSNDKLDYLIQVAQSSTPAECQVIGGQSYRDYLKNLATAVDVAALARLNEIDSAAASTLGCARRFDDAANPYSFPYVHYHGAAELVTHYPTILSKSFALGSDSRLSHVMGCSAARLLDPTAILWLGRTRIAVDPLLYLSTTSGVREPSFFTASENRSRHNGSINKLTMWEAMADCAIAQQSLITGGTLFEEPILNSLQAALVGTGEPQAARARFARDMVNSDFAHLRINLATRIIHTEFRDHATAWGILRDLENRCAAPGTDTVDTVKSLNGLVRRQRFAFVAVAKPYNQGCSVAIRVGGKADGTPFEALLNVAPAPIVAQGRAIYPEEVDALVALKVELARRRSEYELSRVLAGDPDAEAYLAKWTDQSEGRDSNAASN